jgi:hypothetical protein
VGNINAMQRSGYAKRSLYFVEQMKNRVISDALKLKRKGNISSARLSPKLRKSKINDIGTEIENRRHINFSLTSIKCVRVCLKSSEWFVLERRSNNLVYIEHIKTRVGVLV